MLKTLRQGTLDKFWAIFIRAMKVGISSKILKGLSVLNIQMASPASLFTIKSVEKSVRGIYAMI